MAKKQNKRRTKRIRNLVIICTLTAIVLVVSTYAWFIGMRSVSVSSFDVEIAATDSLWLSLDGAKWSTEVNISKEKLDDVSYSGHKNSWGGDGLFPVSSIGEMDNTVSRMKLFEKASLTTTAGGYRLMASRVLNYTKDSVEHDEQDGYVVFDLFVRNFSGTQYLTALNTLDEEAIYLTTDSSVTVASSGVANTGIENSVRVAFTQIGRVAGTTTTPNTITNITCTDSSGDNPVTGICRKAQIWEPNDTAHNINAINWYDTSCRVRTGINVIDRSSYNTTCNTVANGITYKTYAITNDIKSSDNVDIYDGADYNKYTGTISSNPETDDLPLYAYPYFTDTMKNLKGTSRPTFMTLAPNSITKLRIYIYIEGQDVDNYDFASIGKAISVKFGFTKERFEDDDIGYNGPSRNVILPSNDIIANHVS